MKLKRSFITLLFTVCMVFFCTLYCSALSGDIDNNGVISIYDARYTLRASLELEQISETETDIADVNRDGYVTTEDARLILSAAAGISFPEEHSYTPWVVIKSPTCTADGYATSGCLDCGKVFTKILPAAHKFTPATCTQPSVCSVCGEKSGSALGHNYVNGICTRCGEAATAKTVLTADGKTIGISDTYAQMIDAFGQPTYSYADSAAHTPVNIYVYCDDYSKLKVFVISSSGIVEIYTNIADAVVTDGTSQKKLDEIIVISKKNTSLKLNMSGSEVEIFVDTLLDGLPEACGVKICAQGYSYDLYETTDYSVTEALIFHATNGYRAANGVNTIKYSAQVSEVARNHSRDMADNNYFDHVDLSGGHVWDRLNNKGVDWLACGENISAGYYEAFSITNGWFNSDGHRINILSQKNSYNTLGVGIAYNDKSDYRFYTTQVFVNP